MRTKFILLLLILLKSILSPVSVNAEDERWDAESGVYSNFVYGYTIRLFDPSHWEKTAGSAQHTAVRFDHTENGYMLTVNIIPMNEYVSSGSTWDVYDNFKGLMQTQIEYLQKQLGSKILSSNCSKVIFCGKKSVKTSLLYEMESDQLPAPMKILQESYSFLYNNATFTVGAKGLYINKNSNKDMNSIFSCFGLIHSNETIEKTLSSGVESAEIKSNSQSDSFKIETKDDVLNLLIICYFVLIGFNINVFLYQRTIRKIGKKYNLSQYTDYLYPTSKNVLYKISQLRWIVLAGMVYVNWVGAIFAFVIGFLMKVVWPSQCDFKNVHKAMKALRDKKDTIPADIYTLLYLALEDAQKEILS